MSTKSLVIVFCLVLLLFGLVLATCVRTARASPKTITVPDDYSTISAAIGNATSGDTIFVRNGTYREQQLIINKQLSLIGENEGGTKIILNPPWIEENYPFPLSLQYQSHYADAVDITANNVTISGLSMLSYAGSFVTGAQTRLSDDIISTPGLLFISGGTITRSIVTGGIYDGGSNVISENRLYGVWTSSSSLIEGNIFENGAGIYLFSGSTIFNNTVKNCTVGISFYGGGYNAKIYYNNFINNRLYTVGVENRNYNQLWINKWDNGTVGNYWSDYSAKYPNASAINGTNIWDTPYVLDANNIDNYPLMAPINISLPFSNSFPFNSPLPSSSAFPSSPTPTQTPTLLPNPSPSPSIAPSPTPIQTPSPTPSLTPTLSPSPTIPEFPSWIILPVLLIIPTLVAAAIKRKSV